MEKYLEDVLWDKMMSDKERVKNVKLFIEESWKDWLGEMKDSHEAFKEYEKIADILKSIEAIVESDARDKEDMDMKHEVKQIPYWQSTKLKEEYCRRLEERVREVYELRQETKNVLYGICSRVGGDKWWQAYTDSI